MEAGILSSRNIQMATLSQVILIVEIYVQILSRYKNCTRSENCIKQKHTASWSFGQLAGR
jgi:hypothetical protein